MVIFEIKVRSSDKLRQPLAFISKRFLMDLPQTKYLRGVEKIRIDTHTLLLCTSTPQQLTQSY